MIVYVTQSKYASKNVCQLKFFQKKKRKNLKQTSPTFDEQINQSILQNQINRNISVGFVPKKLAIKECVGGGKRIKSSRSRRVRLRIDESKRHRIAAGQWQRPAAAAAEPEVDLGQEPQVVTVIRHLFRRPSAIIRRPVPPILRFKRSTFPDKVHTITLIIHHTIHHTIHRTIRHSI